MEKHKSKTTKKKEYSAKEKRDFHFYATYMNKKLFLGLAMLCAFGLVMVFSTTAHECATNEIYNGNSFYLMKKQLVFMVLGFGAIAVIRLLNYNLLSHIAKFIYAGSLACIILLKSPLGVSSHGATRWLNIGIQFQVAEVVKIAVIIMLATYVTQHPKALDNPKMAIHMWVIGGFQAFLLYLISNDLSSSLIVLFITFGMSFIATQTVKLHLITGGGLVGIASLYVIHIAKNLPSPSELDNMSFRIGRIVAWLAPEKYPDVSYQTLQALYAIGSGGIGGKGLGRSVQKITAIPEAQNDMIFSIICEELGVIGVSILFVLFAYLFAQLMQSANHAENAFGGMLSSGILIHIASQTIVNIAVNVNIFPNTGLALPFISYGGSAIFLMLCEMGIVSSVDRRSSINEYRDYVNGR